MNPYNTPRHEKTIIACTMSSLVLVGIRDYKSILDNPKEEIHMAKFNKIRSTVDNEYAQEAIKWFDGTIKDCEITFEEALSTIQDALSHRPAVAQAIKRQGGGLAFIPEIVAERIFSNPNQMEAIFSEIKGMFSNFDNLPDQFETESAMAGEEVDNFELLSDYDDMKYLIDFDDADFESACFDEYDEASSTMSL